MSYDSEVLADSPLAYWKMNDASSPCVDAVSAYNMPATGSPTFGVTGPITSDLSTNKAVLFAKASSQYVQAASNVTFALGNVFSFEFWIKPTTLGTTAARQSVIANTGASHTPAIEVGGSTGVSGTPGRISETTPGVFIAESPANSIATGSWQHVVYTRTAAGAGHQSLYINGVLQTLSLDAAETYVDAAVTWAIGRRTNGSQFFDGAIARVAIYGSALSSTRISAHYAAATAASSTVTDTFTDTAGTNLTAHTPDVGTGWAAQTGSLIISGGGRARRPSGTDTGYYRVSPAPATSNYSVDADIFVASVQPADRVGVGVHMDSSTTTWYGITWGDGGFWEILACSSGTQTLLYTGTINANYSAGSTHHVKVYVSTSGSTTTFSVLVDGVDAFPGQTLTDSSIPATGYSGIVSGYTGASTTQSDTAGAHVDNFQMIAPATLYPAALSVGASNATSTLRTPRKLAAASSGATASIAKVPRRSLAATCASSASSIRSVSKLLGVGSAVTAAFAAIRAIRLTIAASAASLATANSRVVKAISAAIATSATVAGIRSVLLNLAASATSTASAARSVRTTISASVASGVARASRATKALSASAPTLAAVAAIRTVLLVLAAPSATAAATARRAGKGLVASSSSAASSARSVRKSLSAISASTATEVTSKAAILVIVASETVSAVASRVVAKAIAAASTTSATVSTRLSYARTLTASTATSAAATRQVAKRIAATSAATAAVLSVRVALLTLSAVASSAATAARSARKVLGAGAPATAGATRLARTSLASSAAAAASATRQARKVIAATGPTSASVTLIRIALLSLSATAGTAASLLKRAVTSIAAGAASAASATRQARTRLSAAASTAGTLSAIRSSVVTLLTLTASATVSAAASRRAGRTLAATAASSARTAKMVAKSLAASSSRIVSLVAHAVASGVGLLFPFDATPVRRRPEFAATSPLASPDLDDSHATGGFFDPTTPKAG